MDERLWSELPEELLDRVLSWLPVRSFFRMSSVCRRWSSILNDAGFISMCAFGPSHAPWCILPEEKGYAIYDSAFHTWHNWPEIALPTKTFEVNGTINPEYRSQVEVLKYQIVAADSGLLLLECRHEDSSRTLFVANPINRYARQLRLRVEMEMTDLSTILGLVMDRENKTYKVLEVFRCEDCVTEIGNDAVPLFVRRFQLDAQRFGLSHYNQDPLEFHVYDSSTHDWERTGDWDRQLNHYFRRLAFHDGFIYCLTSDLPFDFLNSYPNLHVYRVAKEGWVEVQARLPSPLHFAHLFEHRGHLMLAGGTGTCQGSSTLQTLNSLHIWCLDSVRSEWIKVHSIPKYLIDEISLPNNCYYRCVSSGGHVCIANSEQKIVMCDLARDSWWLIPRHPSLNERHQGDLFMLQPSLDLVP